MNRRELQGKRLFLPGFCTTLRNTIILEKYMLVGGERTERYQPSLQFHFLNNERNDLSAFSSFGLGDNFELRLGYIRINTVGEYNGDEVYGDGFTSISFQEGGIFDIQNQTLGRTRMWIGGTATGGVLMTMPALVFAGNAGILFIQEIGDFELLVPFAMSVGGIFSNNTSQYEAEVDTTEVTFGLSVRYNFLTLYALYSYAIAPEPEYGMFEPSRFALQFSRMLFGMSARYENRDITLRFRAEAAISQPVSQFEAEFDLLIHTSARYMLSLGANVRYRDWEDAMGCPSEALFGLSLGLIFPFRGLEVQLEADSGFGSDNRTSQMSANYFLLSSSDVYANGVYIGNIDTPEGEHLMMTFAPLPRDAFIRMMLTIAD